MLKGMRKFIAFWGAIGLGFAAFIIFLFAAKADTMLALGAFYALEGTCLNFFNRSNLKEHENGNGNEIKCLK